MHISTDWWLLFFLAVGAILYTIGNERLLTLTLYNPSQSRMTQTMQAKQTTESLQARLWWTIQLAGLTLGVISTLELAVKFRQV